MALEDCSGHGKLFSSNGVLGFFFFLCQLYLFSMRDLLALLGLDTTLPMAALSTLKSDFSNPVNAYQIHLCNILHYVFFP